MNILKLYYDSDSENPRTFNEYSSTLCLSSRFHCDKTISDINEFISEILEIDGFEVASNKGMLFYSNEFKEHLFKLFSKEFIWLKVYKYEHSGICFNTTGFSCPWDSGLAGLIYISKDRVKEYFKKKRISKKLIEAVELSLNSEIEEYNAWVNSEVVYFIIEDEQGNSLDSCGGFYTHYEGWEKDLSYQIDRELLNNISEKELIELIKTTEIQY